MNDHLVLGSRHTEPMLHKPKDALELGILEGDHRTAPLADQVMVMLARCKHHLKRCHAVNLDAPEQPVAA